MEQQQMVYDVLVNQGNRSLAALKNLLVKATEHAEKNKFSADQFLTLKMAPDMMAFNRQIQIATDIAKGGVARLSGKEAVVFKDDETTMVALIDRIEKTQKYISEFKAQDFKDYATKTVSFPWHPGFQMTGHDYFVTHYSPNFFFHITTAYNLLRQHGVQIGKGDYLGNQPFTKV